MNELRCISLIDNIDGYRRSLFHVQNRARAHAVITDCADNAIRRELEGNRSYLQRDIRLRVFGGMPGLLRLRRHIRHIRLRLRRQKPRGPRPDGRCTTQLYKIASLHNRTHTFFALANPLTPGGFAQTSVPDGLTAGDTMLA